MGIRALGPFPLASVNNKRSVCPASHKLMGIRAGLPSTALHTPFPQAFVHGRAPPLLRVKSSWPDFPVFCTVQLDKPQTLHSWDLGHVRPHFHPRPRVCLGQCVGVALHHLCLLFPCSLLIQEHRLVAVPALKAQQLLRPRPALTTSIASRPKTCGTTAPSPAACQPTHPLLSHTPSCRSTRPEPPESLQTLLPPTTPALPTTEHRQAQAPCL